MSDNRARCTQLFSGCTSGPEVVERYSLGPDTPAIPVDDPRGPDETDELPPQRRDACNP